MKRLFHALAGLSLVLVFYVAKAEALTLSEIETAVRRNVRDTASSSSLQRYSDTYIDTLANEAQRDIINETWALSETLTVASVVGTRTITLATDTISVERVSCDSRNLPETTVFAISRDNANTDWETDTGVPKYFFQYPSSKQYVYLYPIPSSGNNCTVRVYFFVWANDMSSDSDEPFDGVDKLVGYHDLEVYFISARILDAEGIFEKATTYKQLYEAGIENMRNAIGAKIVKTPPLPVSTKP